ncbi:MAG TPA: FAD-binding protein [Acidimicrobiales bacterium]|nr:FAD-binding protein [Acidimicrobiales bacterium]
MFAGLRIAVLIKQVPTIEGGHATFELGTDGRLIREGLDLEINPFCRRAITKGVELAKETGGVCIAVTLGPPSAEDALREAIAAGVDRALLISDQKFVGSDTLATARALASAITLHGPFDLVLSGLNSVDAETGQVGAQIAELLDVAFVSGVRQLELDGRQLELECERDDGLVHALVELPALLSVAERLTYPAKHTPEERALVDPAKITWIRADELGTGPWGQEGSPTWVGDVRLIENTRLGKLLSGSLDAQLDALMEALRDRSALDTGEPMPSETVPSTGGSATAVIVALEPGRERFGRELLGGAARLAHELDGSVYALVSGEAPTLIDLGGYGADRVIRLSTSERINAEDIADALVSIATEINPSILVAPSSSWGREVAARFCAATNSGLTGDASSLEVANGRLVAWKPAFGGQLEASITATSPIQCATVRAGAFSLLAPRDHMPTESTRLVSVRGRVAYSDHRVDEAADKIAGAPVLISIGAGVDSERYAEIGPLVELLNAELIATRKVTDKGWLPRTRQVGITGLHVRPLLCVVIGAVGKFNHMVGVRAAGTVVGINIDEASPLFAASDLGIVGDWAIVIPALTERIAKELTN